MYAQVLTTQAEPGLALDERETVRLWKEHLEKIFKDERGFRGAYVLGNQGERTAVTITLWESEEDADSAAGLDLALRHIHDSLGTRPTINGYAVIFHI